MATLTELPYPKIEPTLGEVGKEAPPEIDIQASSVIRKLADFILIGVFCTVLLLPVSDMLFDIDPTPSIQENRLLAGFPTQKHRTFNMFPRQFEAYFNDHFGFRQSLIQGRSLFLTFFLNTSPSRQVIFGKDDWLFINSELESYQAAILFNKQELNWAQNLLEQDSAALKNCGIHYLVVIAPNKSTIYPEYMPEILIRVNNQGRLDQLVGRLQGHPTIDFIDLRPALKKAKSNELLYNQTDSHWNDVGAFVAYQEIALHLQERFPQIQPMSRTNFKFIQQPYFTDMLLLAGLQNVWRENIRMIKPHQPFIAGEVQIDFAVDISKLPKSEKPFALETGDMTLPDAVIFHDSFFKIGKLYQLIAEHFNRVTFYHHSYVRKNKIMASIIEHEQPNVVIYEMAERELQDGPSRLSPDPGGMKDFTCR